MTCLLKTFLWQKRKKKTKKNWTITLCKEYGTTVGVSQAGQGNHSTTKLLNGENNTCNAFLMIADIFILQENGLNIYCFNFFFFKWMKKKHLKKKKKTFEKSKFSFKILYIKERICSTLNKRWFLEIYKFRKWNFMGDSYIRFQVEK